MIAFEVFNSFPDNFPVIATLVSAVLAVILGFVWYNPVVMGKKMNEEFKREGDNFKPGILVYIVAVVLWFFTSFVYSFLTSFLLPPSISGLLGLSTFLWVGFMLPTILLNGMFNGKKLIVMAVDSSYFLAGLYLFAVIHAFI